MNWMLRLIASPALKSGVAIALRVLVITQNALRGVLANDSISDAARKNIETALQAISAVYDFIFKLANLFGIAAYDVVAGVSSVSANDMRYVDSLKDITKRL